MPEAPTGNKKGPQGPSAKASFVEPFSAYALVGYWEQE
jgi:hypothetical protein